MTSRREVAAYLAARLDEGRERAVELAAAWLVDRRRTRQTGYLVSAVATELEPQGYLYAVATSARPLTAATKRAITAYLTKETNATTIELVERIDPDVIGGLRLDLPEAMLDDTVAHHLRQLEETV